MPPLDDELREYFQGFIDEIRADLCALVSREVERFPSADRLLGRFNAASHALLEHGLDGLSHFQEVHNELCLAVTILEDPAEPRCTRIDFEPALPNCDRRFDFRTECGPDVIAWLEAKTIHPARVDAWERYQAALASHRFPENARLVLDRDWLGGELYHNAFAAREKILSYTVETEGKVALCLGDRRGQKVFLVLFSNGFDWHIEDLQDFLHLYRYRRHFDGDHFRVMEDHYIQLNSIELRRNIDYFAYIKRPTTAVRPVGGSWNVQPVRWPPVSGP